MGHGFYLIREERIAEMATCVRLYRHKTGAHLLSLSNGDENKVFGAAFRTPVPDSTGVAHILEHAVLCGSRKYPVKEPFLELLKGSLNTFLNAFTYPDRTCYPVASQNLQDFYNLVDVYLDAVFHPRLTPHVFQQEGWHYALDAPSAPLEYSGVVYNEMKGEYSDPESLLYTTVQQALLPDTIYRHDSGGDPQRIPDLTFEQFTHFHGANYHPANALLWFYGDDDPQRRLILLEEYLSEFESREVTAEIVPQPLCGAPWRRTRACPAGSHEGHGAMVTVNWLLPADVDTDTRRALLVLAHVLLGMPGSPLRRALIESGLGEDLTGVGLECELRQLYFSTGLKGVKPEAVEQVEKIILETLAGVERDGIDPEMRAAALNTINFRLRENNTGSAPRGLILMLRAVAAWLYGGDPFERLAFQASMDRVRQQIQGHGRYLEQLLHRHLVGNPHRVTVILQPDPELEERQLAQERQRLEDARASMSTTDLRAVAAAAARLRRLQSTPDRPEDLARLPSLRLADLPRQARTIPTEAVQLEQTRCLFHDLTTNGIAYVDMALDAGSVPAQLLPYLNLFGRALLEMGTETQDYAALSQRIAILTGGIRARGLVGVERRSGAPVVCLCVRGKAMIHQAGELLDIVRDVFLEGLLDERERFRQIVLEEKAQEEMSLVPDGARFVSTRLGAHYHKAGRIIEKIRGVSYVFFLRRLVQRIEHDWDGVRGDLADVRRTLVNRQGMLINVTLPGADRAGMEAGLRQFLRLLPCRQMVPARWTLEFPAAGEALLAPTQVNHVGKAVGLFDVGFEYDGSATAVARYVAATWLWEQVRVQGGAYGASCSLEPFTGLLRFTSYRDPHLVETLTTFDHTGEFLRQLNLTDAELTRAVIGTIGDLDMYQLPDARGYTAMVRYLTGVTDAYRQQVRDRVLAMRASDFRAMAEVLNRACGTGRVVILASPEAVDRAQKMGLSELKRTRVL